MGPEATEKARAAVYGRLFTETTKHYGRYLLCMVDKEDFSLFETEEDLNKLFESLEENIREGYAFRYIWDLDTDQAVEFDMSFSSDV